MKLPMDCSPRSFQLNHDNLLLVQLAHDKLLLV